MYNDPWSKPKGIRWRVGGEDPWGGEVWWGVMETTVLEQQLIK